MKKVHFRRVELRNHPGIFVWGVFRSRKSRAPFAMSRNVLTLMRHTIYRFLDKTLKGKESKP